MAEESKGNERLQMMPEEEQSGDKEVANEHQKKKKATKHSECVCASFDVHLVFSFLFSQRKIMEREGEKERERER